MEEFFECFIIPHLDDHSHAPPKDSNKYHLLANLIDNYNSFIKLLGNVVYAFNPEEEYFALHGIYNNLATILKNFYDNSKALYDYVYKKEETWLTPSKGRVIKNFYERLSGYQCSIVQRITGNLLRILLAEYTFLKTRMTISHQIYPQERVDVLLEGTLNPSYRLQFQYLVYLIYTKLILCNSDFLTGFTEIHNANFNDNFPELAKYVIPYPTNIPILLYNDQMIVGSLRNLQSHWQDIRYCPQFPKFLELLEFAASNLIHRSGTSNEFKIPCYRVPFVKASKPDNTQKPQPHPQPPERNKRISMFNISYNPSSSLSLTNNYTKQQQQQQKQQQQKDENISYIASTMFIVTVQTAIMTFRTYLYPFTTVPTIYAPYYGNSPTPGIPVDISPLFDSSSDTDDNDDYEYDNVDDGDNNNNNSRTSSPNNDMSDYYGNTSDSGSEKLNTLKTTHRTSDREHYKTNESKVRIHDSNSSFNPFTDNSEDEHIYNTPMEDAGNFSDTNSTSDQTTNVSINSNRKEKHQVVRFTRKHKIFTERLLIGRTVTDPRNIYPCIEQIYIVYKWMKRSAAVKTGDTLGEMMYQLSNRYHINPGYQEICDVLYESSHFSEEDLVEKCYPDVGATHIKDFGHLPAFVHLEFDTTVYPVSLILACICLLKYHWKSAYDTMPLDPFLFEHPRDTLKRFDELFIIDDPKIIAVWNELNIFYKGIMYRCASPIHCLCLFLNIITFMQGSRFTSSGVNINVLLLSIYGKKLLADIETNRQDYPTCVKVFKQYASESTGKCRKTSNKNRKKRNVAEYATGSHDGDDDDENNEPDTDKIISYDEITSEVVI